MDLNKLKRQKGKIANSTSDLEFESQHYTLRVQTLMDVLTELDNRFSCSFSRHFTLLLQVSLTRSRVQSEDGEHDGEISHYNGCRVVFHSLPPRLMFSRKNIRFSGVPTHILLSLYCALLPDLSKGAWCFLKCNLLINSFLCAKQILSGNSICSSTNLDLFIRSSPLHQNRQWLQTCLVRK